MDESNPFETRARDYDAWYDENPDHFGAEIEAVRALLPPRRGPWIEIGAGTGRFAAALKIDLGIEPSAAMGRLAVARGVEVRRGVAEQLPVPRGAYDAAFFLCSLEYVANVGRALDEAQRILRPHGTLIVASIPRESPLGRAARADPDVFLRSAHLFTPDELLTALGVAGFSLAGSVQTLLEDAATPQGEIERPRAGHDLGSFVVLRATAPGPARFLTGSAQAP
ncbi:MAG: class I SAM-dependent methyltransferase [Candidatus Bipolaricaulota bacterium]